ncbi:helix-turn-helix domain-containing protein [Microbacterium sp. CFH 90308]|uniref:Helix-turn-helix domain-containing protein n=2 Tax=Microbacterium salsuginis TaxID=2722803 RepID=A0ABX1K791_9MICO|nr:helix-turn-helix domain-containing protein [Microbacterium sp. CFH 90308]
MAALADPVRRELYRLAADHAIGRDEAAEALGIPRTTAAFHLDRLADAGLLAVSYERRSGRTGPGAGRPAKLYLATQTELALTVPERHYELVGDVLAAAADRADAHGVPIRDALAAEAFAAGSAIGATRPDLESALTACGYEPRDVGTGDLVLENCPFHALASRHTSLICGANVELVGGLAAATGDERTAVLAPAAGRCCVEVRSASS